eukprot:6428684-Pyramimonas_sp.AAC.1
MTALIVFNLCRVECATVLSLVNVCYYIPPHRPTLCTLAVGEEHELRKAHLGLLIEAGWHLDKLRELE